VIALEEARTTPTPPPTTPDPSDDEEAQNLLASLASSFNPLKMLS
jgi:hypothetical protein